MKSCPICAGAMREAFQATVLKRHRVAYFRCAGCGLLQTEQPYWLEEAYAAPIAAADTGLLHRNLGIAARLAALLYFGCDPRAAYLDLAGGYGTLVRLMRDLGFDFYWHDPYTPNLLARGFEADQADRPFAALTAFEVLEHLEDSLAFVAAAFAAHGTRTLIFSTQTYAGDMPPPDWWYYSFATGQHISFYQPRTLAQMAQRLNVRFYSLPGLSVFTDRPLAAPRLRAVTGALAVPLALYARLRLGSRTMRDHEAMLRG